MVVDKADGKDRNTKEDNLDTPVKARYVKLTVPRTAEDMNAHTSRIYAFDVKGEKITDGVADVAVESSQIVLPSALTAGQTVAYAATNCVTRLYTIAGALVDSAVSAEGSYTVPAVAPGLYILSVCADEGTATAKVTVR